MMLKRHPRSPAHLFLDDIPYFISGGIYQKRPLLAKSVIKNRLLELIQKYFEKYGWELHHWVILDNHYHILGKSRTGKHLTKIFQTIHSQSAIFIRKLTDCEKPVWWNYWDYCPRNEKEYRIRCNYLLNNPVKHGYVTNLSDYPFSSFHNLFADRGRESLLKQFQNYPEYKMLILLEAQKDDF